MSKKLIAITGASSGFGAAIAKQFSIRGHPLLLMARRVEKLNELNLPNSICIEVDVTDKKALENAVAQAEKIYGSVDCLVNNAGLMLLGDVSTQNTEEWKAMYDTNVIGLLNGMQVVLNDMKNRKHGTIINISSVAGRKTFENHASYSGTKFAVHAISESVRQEVSPFNVRVIIIAPGAAETELLSHTTSNDIKQNYTDWKKDIGGVMSADDVASSVVFAYGQPQSVCIREIVIASTKQEP